VSMVEIGYIDRLDRVKKPLVMTVCNSKLLSVISKIILNNDFVLLDIFAVLKTPHSRSTQRQFNPGRV